MRGDGPTTSLGSAYTSAHDVSALAGPGKILVTNTGKDLVIGSELTFADRRAHTLKGVPGEWHLWSAN